MAAYCQFYGVIRFTSPAGWLPVHRNQLRAQRSVTSMGKLPFLRGSLGPHETELKRHLPSGLVYPILQGSPVCPTHTDGHIHTDHATPSAAMGRIYDFHVMQPNKCMFWACVTFHLYYCCNSNNAFSALTLLVGRQGGHRPVKTEWSDVQTCICPSWCHCHSLSLASVKSSLVLSFWYRLTRLVPDKGPINVCVDTCITPELKQILTCQHTANAEGASNSARGRKLTSVTDIHAYGKCERRLANGDTGCLVYKRV